MSAHRVANMTQSRQFLLDSGQIQVAMASTTRQASTGHRIQQGSDDPFGTSQTMRLDIQLADTQKYQTTVQDTTSQLNTVDSALSDSSAAVRRIRDLVVQAQNGTYSPQDRAGMNAQIGQIKQTLYSLANTQYAGEFVFGGTATNVAPYASPSNLYNGNNVVPNKLIDDGQAVPASLLGANVFGNGATGLFNTIDQIMSDISTGTPASLANLSVDKTALDGDFDNLQVQHANIGALQTRMDTQLAQLQLREQTLTSSRSNVYDADMAKTYVQLTSQSQMYQASLSAGSKLMQTSLLDFL